MWCWLAVLALLALAHWPMMRSAPAAALPDL
jgi:hypothetical protein